MEVRELTFLQGMGNAGPTLTSENIAHFSLICFFLRIADLGVRKTVLTEVLYSTRGVAINLIIIQLRGQKKKPTTIDEPSREAVAAF